MTNDMCLTNTIFPIRLPAFDKDVRCNHGCTAAQAKLKTLDLRRQWLCQTSGQFGGCARHPFAEIAGTGQVDRARHPAAIAAGDRRGTIGRSTDDFI